MATLGTVAGAAIKVYVNDHPPPHVHVLYQGQEVRLKISDATLLDPVGRFPPRIPREARAWLLRRRDRAALIWSYDHG